MRKYLLITAVTAITAGVVAQAAPAHASTHTERIYAQAQWLIHADRVKVPWDGRYQAASPHGFCIETFNGSTHDITQYGHGVPAGFYLRFCEDGNYFVNDGLPFKHMRSY